MTPPAAAAIRYCVPNLGPAQRQRRKRLGWSMLAVTVVAFAVVGFAAPDRAWRLALAIPAWASAYGFFQAREWT